MEFQFDPKKDEANRKKHGVSLDLARELDWNAMLISEDDVTQDGEERWIGLARRENRLYTTIFTVRGEDTMRIISLRPATNAEIRRYEQQGQAQRKSRTKQRSGRRSDQGRD